MDRAEWTSGYRAKLARADEHLSALYQETDGWGDSDPFRIVRGSNADGSVHEFGLRFETQPNVRRWSLLVGDALHNMRCALDHIVYAMAVQQTGQDPPPDESRLMFPICSDVDHWKRSKRRIACLNEPTRTAIERVQPYNRIKHGQWFAPLWWLAQLNDVDKHRLPHLTVLAAHPDEITTDVKPGTFRALWNEGPLLDGATLLRLELSNPNPHAYVNLRATGAVVFRFKDMKPFGVHPMMKQMRREVGVVCRYLSQFG
jgi:hypothetical protein